MRSAGRWRAYPGRTHGEQPALGEPAWPRNVVWLTQAGVRWLGIHDGTIGESKPVQSGTRDSMVKRFDPGWVTA